MILKKKFFIFMMLCVLAFSVPVQAFSARSPVVRLDLSFDGTTAICYVPVVAENSDDDIEIVVKLWQGKTVIKTWRDDGVGTLFFEEKETVTKGKTYGLSADVTINGEPYPCEVDVATCK